MKVNHSQDIASQPVDMEGASACQVRWLVGEPEGAPTFAMRQFEIAPGGHTPRHHHPYEHEVYVLQGVGVVVDGDVERPLQEGDVVFVAPDDVHQFKNTGSEPMKFLCMVPNTSKGARVTVAPECGSEKG